MTSFLCSDINFSLDPFSRAANNSGVASKLTSELFFCDNLSAVEKLLFDNPCCIVFWLLQSGISEAALLGEVLFMMQELSKLLWYRFSVGFILSNLDD